MNDAPKIDTSGWRLPKKTGRTLDDPVPNDAYAKVGLPVDPEKPKGPQDPADGPAARGDMPHPDTTSWRLPKSTNEKGGERRVLSETGGGVPGLIEDPAELVKKTRNFSESKGKKKRWNDDPPEDKRGKEMLYGGDDEEVDEAKEMEGQPLQQHQVKRGMTIPGGGTTAPWVVDKASAKTVTIRKAPSGVNVGPKLKKKLMYRWDGKGYKRQGEYLFKDGIGKLKESVDATEARRVPSLQDDILRVLKDAKGKKLSVAQVASALGKKPQHVRVPLEDMGIHNKRHGKHVGMKKRKGGDHLYYYMEAERRGPKVKEESVSEYVDANLRQQRILAGLDREDHMPFATGTPHRRVSREMQEANELGEKAWDDVKKMKAKLAKATGVKSHQVSANMSFDKLKWIEAPADKSAVAKVKKAFKGHKVHWDKARERVWVYPKGMGEAKSPERTKTRLSAEQRQLSGLTEAAPVPHGVGDGAAPRRSTGAGILDDQTESGGDYIDRVLQESQWFFRDYSALSLGAFDPLGEAPGGRRGAWRGSDDTAAPTPVVRQGKVKGQVGDDDDDLDGDDDDLDDEPEGDEDDLDTEGVVRKVGGALRGAGGRMSHARSSERAKEKLKQGLRHFAKKHGIKHPRDDD